MYSESDNLIGCFTAFFDHGLLLVEDADTTAVHDGWDAATQPVHFDTDSLYLAVSPAVEGPVAVCVYRYQAPDGETANMTQCFDDTFASKYGAIKLHDPNDSVFLLAREGRGRRRLQVFVDNLDWITRVTVVIS